MARSSISASKILDAPYSLLFPSLFTNPSIQIDVILVSLENSNDKKFPFFINNPLIYNFTTIISIVNKKGTSIRKLLRVTIILLLRENRCAEISKDRRKSGAALKILPI